MEIPKHGKWMDSRLDYNMNMRLEFTQRMSQDPQIMVEESYYGGGEQKEEYNPFEQMVIDHVGLEVDEKDATRFYNFKEDPYQEAKILYDMLEATQAPLWDGCEKYSKLLASLVALSLKSYYMSEYCFNCMVQFMGEAMPSENLMVPNLYYARKLVGLLGLGCIKIKCCLAGCILYCNVDAYEDATKCRHLHKGPL
ncbi:hypothetical protein CR513_24131, partial [Mucuna pruriens]